MRTRQGIIQSMEDKQIIIYPLPKKIGANSCDLTLSEDVGIYGTEEDVQKLLYPEIMTYEGEDYVKFEERYSNHRDYGFKMVLDMKKNNLFTRFKIPQKGLILKPQQLYIGSTVEHTETFGFIPTIETRSSVARLGIQAHTSAGFGDTGFQGTWVLEILSSEPVVVYPGIRICQIAYSRIDGEESAYEGKYTKQSGPTPSQMWKDWSEESVVEKT